MEILSIIALSLSGLTLTALLVDKVVTQFRQQQDEPTARITVKSSCCNKNKEDNHSRRGSHDLTSTSS